MFNKSKLLTLTVITMLGQNAFGSHIKEKVKDTSCEPRSQSCLSPDQKATLRSFLFSIATANNVSPVSDASPDLARSTSPVLFGKEVRRNEVLLVSPRGAVRSSSVREIKDALIEAQAESVLSYK
jgi:hypothetical protein